MPTAFRAPRRRRQLTADKEGRKEADRSSVVVVVRSGFMEFDSGKSKRGGDRGDEDEEGPSLPPSTAPVATSMLVNGLSASPPANWGFLSA